MDPIPPVLSPAPLLHTPMPMLHPESTQSPLYVYPSPALPLPLSPAPGQLVIPPYTPHNGQLWFPPPQPPTYINGDPLYYQPPPLRPASANPNPNLNLNNPAPTTMIPSGLPVSGTPDHVLSSFSQQQQQQQQQQTIGHGALAARISHHLRVTSRARSVSPPPFEVELLSPKPLPSPKLTADDPFALTTTGSFGTHNKRRSLSVVKLEEMAARAAAEAEAALDKTLPAPPVPSRRLVAQDIFKDVTDTATADVPRTPSLSALSLLRPPQQQRHHDPLPKQEDGLDALERRLVEQVGTRRHAPPPPPVSAQVQSKAQAAAADPPPAPVPLPIAVPVVKAAREAEVPNGGAEMNESAISSLALGAEESFGGRNAMDADVDVEVEVEAEAEDLDARTQRLSKGGATGGGGSSGSERGTHKARSRKSVKSDRGKEREKEEKKARKKREGGRDEEAARMKRAAKGRVAEWLEKLASPEQEQEHEREQDPEPEQDTTSAPAAESEEPPPPESKPNPRSSGFISVATLRRAPISLPPPGDDKAPRNVLPTRRVANRYPPPPPPSQVEMKYNVKSARGGRGGRVTAVASIWAEASKGANVPPKPNKPKPKASASTAASSPAPPVFINRGRIPTPAKADDTQPPPPQRAQRALFGLGVAAAATPSSPALSSSIATPVLSSTASLAQPPGAPRARVRARAITPEPESAPAPADSRRSPSPPPQQQQQPQQTAQATGWKAPLVSGAGLKADLAFGQARLRDLIRRYQG